MTRDDSVASKTNRGFRARQLGFSMIELLGVVIILFIVAAYAVPSILNFVHNARLRGAGSDFSSLLQTARIRSVQDDTFYSVYFDGGTPDQAYVDLKSNGGTGVDAGDPLIAISPEVTPVAAANAPGTANLQGQFLPKGSGLTVNDGSTTATPVKFSPRGLPCTTQSATGGTVCDSAGGATAFWVFFKDARTGAWEAVTISPAGRIQRWQYGGTGWTKL
jgi:Tfp pilus assembly protein FimT